VDDETVTLAYTEWTLVELDGEPVEIGPEEIQPTIVLDLEESRVSGSGGVNRLTGTFALSESELRFGSLATTRMAGPESAMHREQSFLAALERVTSFVLDGGALTLLAGDDAVARLSCTPRA
jgi:heat shock protein HslJ